MESRTETVQKKLAYKSSNPAPLWGKKIKDS